MPLPTARAPLRFAWPLGPLRSRAWLYIFSWSITLCSKYTFEATVPSEVQRSRSLGPDIHGYAAASSKPAEQKSCITLCTAYQSDYSASAW